MDKSVIFQYFMIESAWRYYIGKELQGKENE